MKNYTYSNPIELLLIARGLLAILSFVITGSYCYSQNDTNLTYCCKYYIHSNGKLVKGDIGITPDGTLRHVVDKWSDRLFERRIYITGDNKYFYFDGGTKSKSIYAKGFLHPDSILVRQGPTWRYRGVDSVYAYGYYDNDAREGEWSFYRKNGEKASIVYYKRDSVAYSECLLGSSSDNGMHDTCNTKLSIHQVVGLFKSDIVSYIKENKYNGNYTLAFAMWFGNDGKIQGHSYVQDSENNNKFWKSILHAVSSLKVQPPIFKNGIEIEYSMYLELYFIKSKESNHSSLDIKVKDVFFTEY